MSYIYICRNNFKQILHFKCEITESLKAICEAISVAMEIANLPKVPIAMNVTLDKRKSKLVNVKGSTGLLDISSFPELTRNVSETQLLALKTAGLLLNYFYYLYIIYIRIKDL